ncbi:MAG TPA: methyltransferase domain-containing protein [Acidimicrobiales bacterium]|nr:methyltransferase domain-containing protein [Acidimicrobiales bacterium]
MSEYALKLNEAELGRYQFMAETAARMEGSLWAAAGVVQGATVADIGCGPGAISGVLARLVGPSGHVVAVDREPTAVEAARAAAAHVGVGNVSFQLGEAQDSGIAPGSVDVVMIRHVLAHNGGLEQAVVAHAASLVRPGGSVYLVDIEATGLRIRPSDPDLDDLNARYHEWHAQRGNDLSVGLRLGELLTAAGLETVHHEGRYQIISPPPGMRPPSWAGRDAILAAGLATDSDIERWSAAFDRMDRSETRPTMFMPLFFGYGRRPT